MAPSVAASLRSAQFFPDLERTLRKRVPRAAQVLLPRQNTNPQSDGRIGVIIPSTYAGTNGLQPAAVAGIVLGATLGFLFILWIILWGMKSNSGVDNGPDEVIEVRQRGSGDRRRHKRHSHSPTRSRRSRRSSGYVDEIRVSRSDYHQRSGSPRRTQIVEERVVEERMPHPRGMGSRAPSVRAMSMRGPSPMPPPVHHHDTIIVEPRDYSDEDEVIVVEESSTDLSSIPPRRQSGRRRSGGGGGGGAYRPVEGDRYGGGDYGRRSGGRRYS